MREEEHTNPLLAQLSDRSLIEVAGVDAASFLQGLITTDVDALGEGEIAAGALLTPQGKIMFDFLVGKSAAGFMLDSRRDMAQNLHKRLNLYKLRSQIEILHHDQIIVEIFLKKTPETSLQDKNILIFHDKRFTLDERVARVCHLHHNAPSAESDNEKWHGMRIEHGIAESGVDFDLGDVFPHDVNFDQIGGVSFKKGCYIGQEVVSRMHHRGTARRRLLLVEADGSLPPKGSNIEAAGKSIGTMGSHIGGDRIKRNHFTSKGLALVRLDRAKAAMDKAVPITAQHAVTKQAVELQLSFPPSVHFTWPEGD